MSGGYSGGWDPAPFLNNPQLDFPTTHYKTAKGRDYMDFGEWAGKLGADRDKTLKGIYMSARMMKYIYIGYGGFLCTSRIHPVYIPLNPARNDVITKRGVTSSLWSFTSS